MNTKPVALGETYHKAGRPRIVWTVERFSPDIGIAHVMLTRVDDPTTKITISTVALSNPQYYCRSHPLKSGAI
ncbi:MAG: hypothetical protein GEU92_04155 [Alphaproteobacteria bacterium]|nr:hypothetical protein [Alphaproteobacteria bacterium]